MPLHSNRGRGKSFANVSYASKAPPGLKALRLEIPRVAPAKDAPKSLLFATSPAATALMQRIWRPLLASLQARLLQRSLSSNSTRRMGRKTNIQRSQIQDCLGFLLDISSSSCNPYAVISTSSTRLPKVRHQKQLKHPPPKINRFGNPRSLWPLPKPPKTKKQNTSSIYFRSHVVRASVNDGQLGPVFD